MKENNKKVLKGLGIGALACFGMLTMTGCSVIKISEQEYNRIMDSVEMIENSVDIYDATRYYNKAITKSMNTSGMFWNNLKVETFVSYIEDEEEVLETYETYLFKTELDQQIYFQKRYAETNNFEDSAYYVLCEDSSGVEVINKDQYSYQKTKNSSHIVDICLQNGEFADLFYFGKMVDNKFEFFQSADILKAEINEEFNYIVTIMFKEYKSENGNLKFTTYEIENEINQESDLLSQTITITTNQYGITTTRKVVNYFTYGKVEYSDFEVEYETLLDYQVSPTA